MATRTVRYLRCAACGAVTLVECAEGNAWSAATARSCATCEMGMLTDEGRVRLTVDPKP